jgi:hypothetical protein
MNMHIMAFTLVESRGFKSHSRDEIAVPSDDWAVPSNPVMIRKKFCELPDSIGTD